MSGVKWKKQALNNKKQSSCITEAEAEKKTKKPDYLIRADDEHLG